MADALRNEVDIHLDGQDRIMRATFTAIRAIEAALGGKSIIAILHQASMRDMSFTDMVTVIFHGLRGHDDTRLTFDQVGEACMQLGFGEASMAAIRFLNVAMQGVKPGKPAPETAPQ